MKSHATKMRSNHIPDQIRFHSENKTRVNNSKPWKKPYQMRISSFPNHSKPIHIEKLAGILPCSTGDDGFRAQCASPVLNSDMAVPGCLGMPGSNWIHRTI